MKILFASSEIYPYVKTGGLADVADALPRALKAIGCEVLCIMPLYGFMDKSEFTPFGKDFCVELGGISYDVTLYSHINGGVETVFVDAALLSSTDRLYAYEGTPYYNNDIRFGLFSAIVAKLAPMLEVDILHLNDWHTALAALWSKESGFDIKVVFTIHNLAYQGVFNKDILGRLGIDESYFNIDSLEYHGKVNFIKAGIAYSDALTTVSPRYATEILTLRFGCGLEGFLNKHSAKLKGILNGIDTQVFDPSSDEALFYNFNSDTLELKYENKKILYETLFLNDTQRPLFIMVSRMVHQKGFDILLRALPKLLELKLDLLILGEGERHFYDKLAEYSKEFDNLEVIKGYDEELSRRIYAGADFLLMPSLYEPCGLNQFIAMRYGAIPIVHSVGGLYDSVHEVEKRCGQGFVFDEPKPKKLLEAIERALSLDAKERIEIQKFNMDCDLSFKDSAKLYDEIYKSLLKESNV